MELSNEKNKNINVLLLSIEGALFLALVVGLFSFSFAGMAQNVTVPTSLEVGKVFPEIQMVRVNEGSPINLVANQTQLVNCVGIIRDYNGDTDISNVSAALFHNSSSSVYAEDDNNGHYTNASCFINTSFGSYSTFTDDEYMVLANCSFNVWYYANPALWNCTMMANNTVNWQDMNSSTQTVNQLLSMILPTSINYGLVNATYVSDEQIANVTNVGNVQVNLSLKGYATNPAGDPWAMNCTQGIVRNISIMYEKYNLTATTPGQISGLTTFGQTYVNLTNVTTVKNFRLPYRQNDAAQYADDTNQTYWRIYVPRGVAGNCTGNIVFGATVAPGS